MIERHLDEKRRFRRFGHSEPVQFQFKDPSRFGGTLSSNLSEGGIRVRLNEFVPVNTELDLEIWLADENIVHCPSRVAWVEKARFGDSYYVGLEFSRGDSLLDSQRKIGRFLLRQKHSVPVLAEPSSKRDGA